MGSAKFSVSNLKIIPSSDDEIKFQTPIELKAKEKQYYEELSVLPHNISSTITSDSQLHSLQAALNADMLQEFNEIQNNMHKEIIELEGIFLKVAACISISMLAVGGFVVYILMK